jgi:diguanylate cyclase (GGDEF)-like protein/PAS domain S-box-containing protein
MKRTTSHISSSFEQSLSGPIRDNPSAKCGGKQEENSDVWSELARYRKLEEGWRRALEASNLGAWSLDVANGEFFYCNTWRRMRGIAEGEEVNLDLDIWIENVHPGDRDRVLSAIDAQNSGKLAFSIIEYRERRRDGRWIWIESRSSVLERDPSGRAARVVGTDADVTDRKANEQAADVLGRKLALAIEVAEIGMFEADLESGQVRRDARLLAMYGLEPETPELDPAGMLQRQRLHPDDHEACMKRIQDGIESGLPFENEFRIITPRGEVRHLRSRSLSYQDNEGRQKLLGVNWDVTRDKTLHEKLQRAVADAEARSGALEVAKETIRQLAIRDELTGLLNRRGLNEQMAMWAEGKNRFAAALHIDLDEFKEINDRLGHHAGDRVLQVAAERLQGLAGAQDVLARWGGDEFVLLAGEDRTPSEIVSLARAVVGAFEELVVLGELLIATGASVGVAWADSKADPVQLLADADAALYRAKSHGKGRVEFARSS